MPGPCSSRSRKLVLFRCAWQGCAYACARPTTDPNIIKTQKREHSRKPDELYKIIEPCSHRPHLELFARGTAKSGKHGAISPMTTIQDGRRT